MDSDNSRNNKVIVPSDDGMVEQALLELDSKLDAWADAILQTQSRLKEYMNSQVNRSESEQGEVSASPTSTEAEEKLPAEETPHPPTHKEIDLDTLLNTSKPKTPIPEASKPIEANVEMPVPEVSTEEVKEEVKNEPESNKESEEDEALLATLEPEMVKKIQVLRRLSNKKKSIRELIDQIKAAPATPEAEEEKPKKRSFWRIG